ncbi:TA system VapC family ribonuclease toxin [Nostocoides veronense]|uniref:Ribonuclease VapC n=1 Tax=Nostocoides veronense TaxID=330836 RepID=A0ABP4YAP5_9MICO
MLVDANILLYAVDADSPFHDRAREWLTEALNGAQRVGLPWMSLWAFLRIATNPRASLNPLSPAHAWGHIEEWLDAPAAWVPAPGSGHRRLLQKLVIERDLRAGLVSDAALAAICLEHGLAIVSADSDFARFPDLRWINPLVAG